MKNRSLGIIFSNIHDNSLHELTEERTTSSVPFGGRYRFVDFVLSSMVNSGIYSVGVIAKTNYESLMDHLGSGREWDLSRKTGGLYILPPYGIHGAGIYRGRIEALYGMMSYLNRSPEKYVVMSDSDIICNMNFTKIVNYHEEKNADITIAYIKKKVKPNKANLTVFSLSGDNRITDVLLEPEADKEHNLSINVVVIEKHLLIKLVNDSISRGNYSFTKDILQKKVDTLNIYGYEYTDYLAKIDDIVDYYNASMDLLKSDVRKELFLGKKKIYTRVNDQAPTRYGLNSKVNNSMIADGCLIEGEVHNSIISRGVYIGKDAKIYNSIVMQGSRVSERACLDYCILDKSVLIKEHRDLKGYKDYPYYIVKNRVV